MTRTHYMLSALGADGLQRCSYSPGSSCSDAQTPHSIAVMCLSKTRKDEGEKGQVWTQTQSLPWPSHSCGDLSSSWS